MVLLLLLTPSLRLLAVKLLDTHARAATAAADARAVVEEEEEKEEEEVEEEEVEEVEEVVVVVKQNCLIGFYAEGRRQLEKK